MKRAACLVAVFLTSFAAPMRSQTAAPQPMPAKPCDTMPEAKQFDFWVGSWTVTPWAGGSFPGGAPGRSEIQPILSHCVILENWTGSRGGQGKSMNLYDPSIHKWRQLWMDEFGGALNYTGEYRDGAMRFDGWTLGTKNDTVLQRLTFFNVSHDTVRQLFETSNDRGKSWQPNFDGRYVRVKR